MAKKKVKFDLKQDVLAECNDKIRDRLFKKPFSIKPKDYLFKAKVDIEVEDPSSLPLRDTEASLEAAVRRTSCFCSWEEAERYITSTSENLIMPIRILDVLATSASVTASLT